MTIELNTFKSRYVTSLRALNEVARPDWPQHLATLYSPTMTWNGPHPINQIAGRDNLLCQFWAPFLQAFPDVERHDDIVVEGQFNGQHWVAATGYYSATFRNAWLGIRPTGGLMNLRYGEFSRVENNLIVEVYCIIDILDVLRQAGQWPHAIPNSRGSFPFAYHERTPPPATRDGIVFTASDAVESLKSLKLVEAMIAGLMQYDGKSLESMGMQHFWHPQMMWYGPAGIGSSRQLTGFQDVHQRDFLTAFPDRKGGNHKARLGDGNYVASTGWPSIRATHLGPWLGCAATGRPITMRVMDFWRRDNDLLRENWVFIDQIDLLKQLDIDVMVTLT